MNNMNWRTPPAMTEEQRELSRRIFERNQRMGAWRMNRQITDEQDDEGPDGSDAGD